VTGRTYRDFDLEIQGDGQGGYRARVLDSPAGQITSVSFTLPFSEDKLENYLLKMGRRPGPTVRGEDAPEAATAREFGTALFDAVFKDNPVGAALTSSLDQTENEEGVGLRLRLRLSNCPELADLPWEFLRRDWKFLALSEWTPVVRFLGLPGRIKPVPVTPPLRVLVHIAAPTDQKEVDAEGEWDRIQQAMKPLRTRGRLTLDRVAHGTWQDLQKQLRQAEMSGGGGYHVFHFIGHGGFSNSAGEGMLAFERASDHRTHRVSSLELGQLLGDRRSLRLAVLNACEGARSTRADPFAGMAQALLRAGIPAVIAHQFPISDSAALDFSQSFYEAVADGYPVDAAVAAARMAVWGEPNPIEWATPVLYLRAPDGRIFDIPVAPEPTHTGTEPQPHADASPDSGSVESDPQWNDALEAYDTGRWAAARDRLTGILAHHPNDVRVSRMLSHAQLQADLAQWYAQAQHAAAAGEWEQAATALNSIVAAEPGYLDAATLLEDARWQQRRTSLIELAAAPMPVRGVSLTELRRAAEEGDSEAQYHLAWSYELDHHDTSSAVKWYRAAAEQGHVRAQSRLGSCFRWGAGVPEDSAEAIRWFRKAAAQGDPFAQVCLGEISASKGDYGETLEWYNKADAQGYALAKFRLGRMYLMGSGVPEDESKGLKLLREAELLGDGEAHSMLDANQQKWRKRMRLLGIR
jgi:TPR repeat protein